MEPASSRMRSVSSSKPAVDTVLGYEDLNDHDELRHDPMMTRRHQLKPVSGMRWSASGLLPPLRFRGSPLPHSKPSLRAAKLKAN
jgi:hypothetical protein